MINNNARLVSYLNSSVSRVFKILPLYEEMNFGVEIYVESLLFELKGLDKVIKINNSDEYISLLSTLESIKEEISSSDSEKAVVKREVFKCISTVKSLVKNIEEGD